MMYMSRRHWSVFEKRAFFFFYIFAFVYCLYLNLELLNASFGLHEDCYVKHFTQMCTYFKFRLMIAMNILYILVSIGYKV